MNKVNIDKNYFKGYIPLYDVGSESFILYKNDLLAKLVNKHLLREDREIITEKLEELDYDGLVKPEFLLYDRKKYIGYVMKFIKNYKSFNDLLQDDSISFEERKKLAIELSQIFDYFYTKRFAYFDIHGNNFLLKDGKIHVIDLDGGVFRGYKNCEMTFDVAYRAQTKYLSAFTIAFIYNMDRLQFLRCTHKNQPFFKSIKTPLKKFYEYASNDDYSVFEGISDSLDLIDEDTFEESSLLLKRKM